MKRALWFLPVATITALLLAPLSPTRTDTTTFTPTEHPPMAVQPPSPQTAPEAAIQVEVVPEPIPTQQMPLRPISGSKTDWMTAAGIPQSEWQYVDFIVSRESGWDPCAYFPSQSDCSANPTTACGLAQSLPCGKQTVYGHWTDPVANLRWQAEYVRERYGSYHGAYLHWTSHKWY